MKKMTKVSLAVVVLLVTSIMRRYGMGQQCVKKD